jgi:hypothetical protein
MPQGVVNQAMIHRFFHSSFMGFRKADRQINLNAEIIHTGRIFQFIGVHPYNCAFSRELVFAQIHGGILAGT